MTQSMKKGKGLNASLPATLKLRRTGRWHDGLSAINKYIYPNINCPFL
jgi:hypothetical protein